MSWNNIMTSLFHLLCHQQRNLSFTFHLSLVFLQDTTALRSASLENIAKEQGINNLVGVITADNEASIKLFERDGYFKVGHLKNIGVKFGKALDVVSYQKEI